MEIKLTRWFVYEWEKSTRQKPHQVTLRSPLPRIHYYHNKRLQVKESQYFIPTYSWTLTPIPNWIFFVVTIFPFNARLSVCDEPIARIPIRDFNHQLEKVVGCKVLQFITRWRSRRWLVTKPYGVQTQQLLHKKDEIRQIMFSVTICMNKLYSTLVQLVLYLTALKIILLYV